MFALPSMFTHSFPSDPYESTDENVYSLTGDGLDDSVYVNEQGATVMWRNLGTNPPSWGLPHLVVDGVDVLPQDVQFADTNGDGRLDYVVVGRTTGRTRSWHNLGFRSDGSIRWNTPLNFADGTGSVGSSIKISEASSSYHYPVPVTATFVSDLACIFR